MMAVNNTVYVRGMLTSPVLCSLITKTAIPIPAQLLIVVSDGVNDDHTDHDEDKNVKDAKSKKHGDFFEEKEQRQPSYQLQP